MSRFTRVIEYNAAKAGLNGVTITSARDGSWIGTDGACQVALEIDYTYGAATSFEFYIETRKRTGDTARFDTHEVPDGSGTYNIYKTKHFYTTNAASVSLVVYINVEAAEFRVADLVGTAANSSDLITISIRTSYNGGGM